MKINPVISVYGSSFKKPKKDATLKSEKIADSTPMNLNFQPVNRSVFFGAMKPKDLISFYNRNTSYMPLTVKNYIDSLSDEDKKSMTPLEAQFNAFDFLSICETPKDIKEAYPDEPLLNNAKSVYDSKATRGLLYDIRLMKDDIESQNETVLKNGEDLTVYLAKKIFLEGKTLGEINKDLKDELNPVFVVENSEYILPSTCRALGINLPHNEYLTSLRYTRTGYAQQKSNEAKQRYLKQFEGMTDDEIKAKKAEILSKRKPVSPEKKAELSIAQSVRSSNFWANLSDERYAEICENMSKAQKKRFSKMSPEELEKYRENSAKAWRELTPEEKTAKIELLQTGSKKQKIIMRHAWNNCPKIREELSKYLSGLGLSGIGSIIYKETNFSEYMSKVMSEFWENNPEFANLLGEQIVNANIEYDIKEENGELEEFEKSVNAKSTQIKREIKAKRRKERETKKEKPRNDETSDPKNPPAKPILAAPHNVDVKKAEKLVGRKYLTPETIKGYENLPEQFLCDWGNYVYEVMKNDYEFYSMLEERIPTREETLRRADFCTKADMRAKQIAETMIVAIMEVLRDSLLPEGKETFRSNKEAGFLYIMPLDTVSDVLRQAKSKSTLIKIPNPYMPTDSITIKKHKPVNTDTLSDLYSQYSKDLTRDEKDFIVKTLLQGVDGGKRTKLEFLLKSAVSNSKKCLLEAFNPDKDPVTRKLIITRCLLYETDKELEGIKGSDYMRALDEEINKILS